jgi:hypothetical protein
MDRKVIAQRIEMMGLEDYATMVEIFKTQVLEHLKHLRLRQSRAMHLHQLKGMSFSVGLDTLGSHIHNIEQMLATGAELTAEMHLKTLPNKLMDSIVLLEQIVAQQRA